MKKNWHFKYWNCPRCYQKGQIWTKKSISQYRYFKHSKWAVLRNLSLIPSITMIGEKKLGCHNTKKPQNRIRIWNIIAWYLIRGFWYLDTLFFSPILIIIGIRLKFQSTTHLECFKYPYWDMLFLAKIWLFWLQRGQFQYLKCHFFFTDPHDYENKA